MLNNRVARWTMAAALAAGAFTQTQAGALNARGLRVGVEAGAVLAGALIEPVSPAAQPPALPPPPASTQPTRRPDVIYVPTNEEVVRGMLKLAGVTKDDIVYDLGCGDGRIPITAARDFGARGVGIDIDPQRIAEANANVKQAGVGNRVQIRQQDLFTADIKEATVVTLYLLQSLNMKLRPKLLADLKPGTRIVSHAFDMGDEWKPEKTEEIGGTRIYFWTVPKK
jgi:SAM-dependent methyltransferase